MRKKLGEILIEAGVLDSFQLQAALGHQRQWGGRLGEILVQKGFVTEAGLAECLARQLSLTRAVLTQDQIDAEVAKLVPAELAERHHVLPFTADKSGERVTAIVVATSDPTNLNAIDEIQFHTGKRVRTVVVTQTEVSAGIRWAYHGEAMPVRGPAPPPAGLTTPEPLDDVDVDVNELDEVDAEVVNPDEAAAPPAAAPQPPAAPPPQAAPAPAAPAPPPASPAPAATREQEILGALEKIAQGEEPSVEVQRWVNPTQMIAALVRILISKGVIDELEFVEELQRK